MRRCAAAALAVVVLAGCGAAAAPGRLPELETEVRGATAALLSAPGFQAAAVRSGEDGTVTRVDWAHWLAGGDYRYVTAGLPEPASEPAVFGLVQVGADLYSAQRGPLGDEPWEQLDEEPTTRIPLSLNLAEIAAGELSAVAGETRGAEVSRDASPAGEVRWTMAAPHRGDRLLETWVIGSDGILRSYAVRTAGGSPIQDGTTAVEYGFTPLASPAPVTAPPLGTAFDAADLGAPADLPLVGP